MTNIVKTSEMLYGQFGCSRLDNVYAVIHDHNYLPRINMAGVVVARRFQGNLQRERVFRYRTNPLEIYDDVELHAKFRFRRIHILLIVDEVWDAIEYPVKAHYRRFCKFSLTSDSLQSAAFRI